MILFLSTVLAQLTYPTMYPTAVIPHPSGGSVFPFAYTPMEYLNYPGGTDTFKIRYADMSTGIRYLARSTNFGITWTDKTMITGITKMREATVRNPDSTKLYMGFHDWDNGVCYMNSVYSTNGGYNFDSLTVTQVMRTGEDLSFFWNEDTNEYWRYIRPRDVEPHCCQFPCRANYGVSYSNGYRKIALTKNNSFFPSAGSLSAMDTILEVSTTDFNNSSSPDYRTQMYYMQVFRTGSDWWGLVGMYRVANNGGDLEPYPHTHPEYTSDVELVWSDNGEDWQRTNNKQAFIPLHDSINTIYSVGTPVGDSIYIYSFESTILHAHYYNGACGGGSVIASAKNGKHYSIYLYKMAVSKLNEWSPAVVANIKASVQGFLNTSTDKHVLRDTLTAELRSSISPYIVKSTTKSVVDSSTLIGNYSFPHVSPGNYYIVVKGRNSLETWSSIDTFFTSSSVMNYDFTNAYAKTYWGNTILTGGKYCIYSGDVDNNGAVDSQDIYDITNDYSIFASGYLDTDLTGDYFVDVSDVTMVYNNASNFVSTMAP